MNDDEVLDFDELDEIPALELDEEDDFTKTPQEFAVVIEEEHSVINMGRWLPVKYEQRSAGSIYTPFVEAHIQEKIIARDTTRP